MILIPLWAKALIVAALISAATWAINAWGNKHERIGYDRAVAEYAVKLADAKADALAKERAMNKQLEDAQNAATERDKSKTARIAALAVTADGLRGTVANLRSRLATVTPDACRKTADVLATVFDDCRSAYEEMGRIAEGHASDSLMYQQAWPK